MSLEPGCGLSCSLLALPWRERVGKEDFSPTPKILQLEGIPPPPPQLRGRRRRVDGQKQSLTQRAIKMWNGLPEEEMGI